MADPVIRNLQKRLDNRDKPMLVVADGDAAHLYYTSLLLQRLEYNIYTTKTAAGVLEILDVAKPALVLSEVLLDGSDGIELLHKIKRNPRTYAVPVIILTASKDPRIQEACRTDSCESLLYKPVEPDALYAAIQKATEAEPRSYIRLNTCLNVVMGGGKDAVAHFDDYITALSEHGMFVSTPKPMPCGDRMQCMVIFEGRKVRIDGTVLYSFQRGAGPLKTSGMGVKFSHISPEDQEFVRTFIRREITKGLSAEKGGKRM